ncbi:MAG: hypothetical protein ABFD75_07685 [Smithella sp.]
MTVSPLESSIQEEATRAIAAIKEKEASEIMQMEEAYAAELESFQSQAETDTEARLQQEIPRLSNRAVLERRKLELQSMEQFISHLVDEVMKNIRHNPLYRQFLLDALLDVARKIPAGLEVRLKPEDLVLEKDILASLATANRDQDIVIKSDPTIRWGGCLIYDETGGRIFNHTLERIYYRKSLLIRQRIVKMLTNHARGEKGQPPTATESLGKECDLVSGCESKLV